MLYWVLKPIFWVLLHSFFSLRRRGVENTPPGAAIVAANHLSLIDSLFIPLLHPRRLRFLAKQRYFDSWKTGWLLRISGQIPLGAGDGTREALQEALRVLRAGGIVAIYPEGTRSPDGRLYRGRTGVARLALLSGAPVVPCAIRGSDRALRRGARFPDLRSRVRVEVEFGPPLRFEQVAGEHELTRERLREVTDEIMKAIAELSGQEYVDRYSGQAGSETDGPAGDRRRAG